MELRNLRDGAKKRKDMNEPTSIRLHKYSPHAAFLESGTFSKLAATLVYYCIAVMAIYINRTALYPTKTVHIFSCFHLSTRIKHFGHVTTAYSR